MIRGNQKTFPPTAALRFFRWYCHPELRNHIEGDLIELYQERLETGKLGADLQFIADVILLFRPGIIKPRDPKKTLKTYGMYKSYFKIGWRNLAKNKVYSVINIGGLALGIAVAMMIGFWVNDELTFNHNHENYPRVAQVMKGGTFEGKYYKGQMHLQYPLISELKTTYGPNLKYIAPMMGGGDGVLSTPDKKLSRKGTFLGEDAPEMFSMKMTYGNRNALRDINSVIISKSTSIALFGDVDPIGQMIKLNGQRDATISGVYEDFPNNSSFSTLDYIAPWAAFERDNTWLQNAGWENHMLFIYVQIADGLTMAQAGEKIKGAEMKAIKNLAYMRESLKYNYENLLLPMDDWHLRAKFNDGVLDTGPIQLVWFIGSIGVFVLVLACINFMNLSTARSEKRAKEVGIRKSIGSARSELIKQFFSESYLVVILAFIIALILDYLLLPAFNQLSGKGITMPIAEPLFWGTSVVFLFITGLVAGSYPALYLSSFNAVSILRKTYRTGKMASIPRKILVVVQFTVSIILIASTGIIYNQLMYVKDRPVGYERQGLLMISKNHSYFNEKADAIRAELLNTGVVAEVAQSGGDVTNTWSGNGGFSWEGKDPLFEANFNTLGVGQEFGNAVGWKFVDGRDFSRDIKSDTAAFVINEAAVKYMKITDPVGKIVHWKNGPWNVDSDFRIIGVIKDMLMDSPFEEVRPAIYLTGGYKGVLLVKITPGKTPSEALPKIEKVFNAIIPDIPFTARFADTEFAAKFKTEERIGKLAGVFASLAILISCLGLFGLAAYVAEQRTKEIGIRKVLGASVVGLWGMLSREFVILVTVSCALAIPISYYILDEGISKYKYHTAIGWHIFALSAGGALLITVATVSLQAIRAAVANPVNSLRSE